VAALSAKGQPDGNVTQRALHRAQDHAAAPADQVADYRRRAQARRFRRLDGPRATALVALDDDTRTWPRVPPESYWGAPFSGFVLRGEFAVPTDWPADAPVALWLPLGDGTAPGHPEALVYVDGVPYAGCDRHHQEIALPAPWRDGRAHDLALHGWIDLPLARARQRRAAALYGRVRLCASTSPRVTSSPPRPSRWASPINWRTDPAQSAAQRARRGLPAARHARPWRAVRSVPEARRVMRARGAGRRAAP
jgi:hypothetical protein